MMKPQDKSYNSPHSWVFLRGLARESRHWDTFLAHFEKKMDAKVTCLDYPGVGQYFQEKSPSTIDGIVDHLQKTAHLPKSWILAHSMGCVVATEWMRREPEKFFGAVYTNTSLAGMSWPFKRLKPSGLYHFIRVALFRNHPRKREEIKFDLSCKNQQKKEHTIQLWMDIQRTAPVTNATALNQMQAAALYKVKGKPSQPILLLNSLGDVLVEPECSEDISATWNLPLQTHPWAGHEIFHDDGEWVISAVQSWLGKQDL